MRTIRALIVGAIFLILWNIISSADNVEGMSRTRRASKSRLKNIYGKPLRSCRRKPGRANRGSWDREGKCSEMDGGVHQICVHLNEGTKGFSRSTKQGNWSLDRVGKNHCMCLGAWALFKARQNLGEIPPTAGELVCDAIPDTALTPQYISEWNTWNGHQKNNQIMDGVRAIYEQCSPYSDAKGRAYLKKKYNYLLGYIVSPQHERA